MSSRTAALIFINHSHFQARNHPSRKQAGAHSAKVINVRRPAAQ
jgi:hypothetical protein